MSQYNKENPYGDQCVQLYRKESPAVLKRPFATARDNGYLCAVKLVRGAYMEKNGPPAAMVTQLYDTKAWKPTIIWLKKVNNFIPHIGRFMSI